MGNVTSTSANDHRWAHLGDANWPPSRVARWCFLLGILAVSFAGLLALTLSRLLGRPQGVDFHLPVAFLFSSLLLGQGSVQLLRALQAVRRERQGELQHNLTLAIVIGVLFMGTQTYALWTILPLDRSLQSASAGVAAFAIVLAAMHMLHFLVATLCAIYVRIRAHAGRYDHEYHWGVTVCGWFWHALGVIWLAILAVYGIASVGH